MAPNPYVFNPHVLRHLPDRAYALLDDAPSQLVNDLYSAAEYAAARLADEACGYTLAGGREIDRSLSYYEGIDAEEAWHLVQMQLVPQAVNTLATEVLRRAQQEEQPEQSAALALV